MMGVNGFIKICLKLLFIIGAAATGLILLWSLLLMPGRILHLENEVRSLATVLELVTMAYLTVKILTMHRFRLEKTKSIVSMALKSSIVFYFIGLAALLLGFVRHYSFIGFVGAALYSLTGNLVNISFSMPEYINRSFSIPVPSINPPSELPLSLCTPPSEGVVVSFNIHLGSEARSWISFKLKHMQLLSRSLREYAKQLVLILDTEPHQRKFPDIRCHLSKKISRGYLLDPSKPIDETLKIFNQIGRKGVEVSLQFAWMRMKGSIMAHHILLASSNDLKAFSRFETDLIRKLPLLDFIKTDTAIQAVRRNDKALLKHVGEIYLRNILPLDLSYESHNVVERITLRDYVDERESRPLSLPFPDGHALLVGGKSSGKTRFAKNLVLALKELGVVTLIIDPNGEYGEVRNEEESSYLNPLKPPADVDVLTHSGSLLVFSPTIASVFSIDDPQEKILEMIKLKEPSFRGFLLEIEGKVDEESARLRKTISKLIDETEIDEAIRKISLPHPKQNVICVRAPSNNKKTTSFLTELFFAWGASLAISKRTEKVVMVIEDAEELLKNKDISKLLGYAKDYGLSLIIITRNFEGIASLGTCFSIIVGFGIFSEIDLFEFQRLIGVRRDEPEGLQVESKASLLKSGECIIFLENSFEFLMAKPMKTQEVITFG